MPNPNAFTFQCMEKTCYADPIKVRRVLLTHTMGKCWGIIQELRRKEGEILEARTKAEELEKDVADNPTTPEEAEKLSKIQTLRAEGKQHTYPFEELPRVLRSDLWKGKVALFCTQIAEMEESLANAAYEAFDLPPFNAETGEGVVGVEALQILKDFVEYAEGKGGRLGS